MVIQALTLNQLFWKLTKEKFSPSWGYFWRSSKDIYNLLTIMLHITSWTLILMLHIRHSIYLVPTNALSTSFFDVSHYIWWNHHNTIYTVLVKVDILDTCGSMTCSYFRTVYTSCQISTLLFINGLIFDFMKIQNNQSIEFEWIPT